MRRVCPIKNFTPCTQDCVFYEKCEKEDSSVSIQFSSDAAKFTCEFLELLTLAEKSGNPIEFFRNTTDSKGKSIYSLLVEMGCNVEEMFERFENAIRKQVL